MKESQNHELDAIARGGCMTIIIIIFLTLFALVACSWVFQLLFENNVIK